MKITTEFLALFFIFFVGCAHTVKNGDPGVRSLCPQALVQSDLSLLKKNIQDCKNFKSSSGTTLLMLAASRGYEEALSYLLEQGVNPNEFDQGGYTAIDYATTHRQVRIIQILLDHGASVLPKNEDQITALMQAVQSGPLDIVNLLARPEVIQLKASDGWTALYFSIRRQDQQIFDLLLARGACPNVIDTYMQRPIDFAEEVGWSYAIRRLQQASACK